MSAAAAAAAIAERAPGFTPRVGLMLGSGLGELAERLRQADRELARTSTELAELQAFNAYVIDSLTSGLATADQNGVLISFNPAAEAITGVTAPSSSRRLRPLVAIAETRTRPR